MNFNKSLFYSAVVSGLVLASGCASQGNAPTPEESKVVGECHGVNSCKAQGDCGGKGHGCAGKNSCKGKGWKKMTHGECHEKGGDFKAS